MSHPSPQISRAAWRRLVLALVALAGAGCSVEAGRRVSPEGGECGASVGCLPGYTCEAGACRALCSDPAPCGSTRRCVSGVCVPKAALGESCGDDSTCAGGLTCYEAFCRQTCDEAAPCPEPLRCVVGVCQSASWAYGPYGSFGACSVTCGLGTRARTRECLGADGLPGPCDECGGVCEELEECSETAACSYGEWMPIGTCGTSCDAPDQPYHRDCLDDLAQVVACSFCGGDCEKTDSCACASCGDGVVQSATGEQCDTGASRSDLSCNACCRTNCQRQRCGDAILDSAAAETCDTGANNKNDSCNGCCRTNCTLQRCGDGITDTEKGETCDAGAANSDSNCASCCRRNCLLRRCGDSVVDYAAGESCDRGASNSDASCTGPSCCRTTCVAPSCGDGITDPYLSETCDAGTASNSNAPCVDCCRTNCRSQRCGDTVVDVADGEECDDGNSDIYDGCASCRVTEKAALGELPAVGVSGTGLVAMAWQRSADYTMRGQWIAPSPGTTAAISFSGNIGSGTHRPDIAMAASGNIVLAWNYDSYYQGVQYVRMAANASTMPSTSYVSTTSDGSDRVAAAMQLNESFVFAWEAGSVSVRDVRVNPFDLNGGSLNAANVPVTTTGDEYDVDVAMDNLGRAIIVWAASDGSGTGIFAQCIDATSSNTTTRVLNAADLAVNQTVSGAQRRAAVAVQRSAASTTGAVVAWRNDPGGNILMRLLTVQSTGCSVTGVDTLVTPSSSNTDQPSVAMDQSGNFVVAWVSNSAVFAQRYDAAGTAQWASPLQVSVLADIGATNPAVATDPSGARIAVVWEASGRVWVQRVSSAGARLHDAAW